MKRFKKGDIVSLKGSKALHVVDIVSVVRPPKSKAVIIYHISGTPESKFYIFDDLVKVK